MTDTGKWNFVDHFGADPQGLVDAAALLQHAVTTICDAGGGTLVIPPGVTGCTARERWCRIRET
ncbi:hypothetical protein [Streptomyces sp. Ac-502]|uniref:hypothetical protein n=1 Tax=Streptomyces sp. Ac-502 TaxID=3342801 RepID=UPI0038628EEF